MKKLGKKLMKKPAAAMKKMKKRSACIKRPAMTSAAVRQRRWRENVLARQKAKQNVLYKARRAARNGLPYQTKLPKLAGVAAAAYAATVEAYSARQAADEAKEDASAARALGLENHKRITLLVGEVKTGLDSWAETAALAKRNAERLDTENRKRGYKTPDQRF